MGLKFESKYNPALYPKSGKVLFFSLRISFAAANFDIPVFPYGSFMELDESNIIIKLSAVFTSSTSSVTDVTVSCFMTFSAAITWVATKPKNTRLTTLEIINIFFIDVPPVV